MSFFGSDPVPTPSAPALPDPLPSPSSFASGGSKSYGGRKKSSGFGSTLMTSSEGVDDSNTNVQRKSLLGQ